MGSLMEPALEVATERATAETNKKTLIESVRNLTETLLNSKASYGSSQNSRRQVKRVHHSNLRQQIMNDIKKFVGQWSRHGYEKCETHSFWLSLLRDVLGVSEPEKFICFEIPVKLKHTCFIDEKFYNDNNGDK